MENEKKETLRPIEVDSVMNAVYELVKQFPGYRGIEVCVESLKKDSVCVGIFADSTGAFYISRNIWGGFRAACPFAVVFRSMPRTSEQNLGKIACQNKLGQWLERREITVDGQKFRLEQYPVLRDGRMIEKIEIASPAFRDTSEEAGDSDFVITFNMTYRKDE